MTEATAVHNPLGGAYHRISPELETALDAARKRAPMTAEELFEQRVSWCYGMQKLSKPNPLTREQIREMLLKHEGRAQNGDGDPMNDEDQKCPCGERPAHGCDEEWGPNCDLGNNEKYAVVHEVAAQPGPSP